MVAQQLGISPVTVNYCMAKGTMPIGIAEKRESTNRYIIFPKALYDVTGIKPNGYEPPPVGGVKELDYDKPAKSILFVYSLRVYRRKP